MNNYYFQRGKAKSFHQQHSIDRKIQILENLSKLRDYQEERMKEFKIREKQYQNAKAQIHLYQLLQAKHRIRILEKEHQDKIYLMKRASNYQPMSQKNSQIWERQSSKSVLFPNI
ncbi:hypothetical protein pb186bvf_012659 [Paramecium bursaria]